MDRVAGTVTGYDEVGGRPLRQAYYRLASPNLIPPPALLHEREQEITDTLVELPVHSGTWRAPP
ncbi:hypothetical protein EAO71_33010 [Streptomyces sp. ms191]|uniref:hypothetical protein n=1 Tax=unclassified Streptomyces TaxID=2593676 RepID=UPI001312127C|nr:hypothetical protein [Streptomyces sp. ms191]TXS20114.1 hypothetical protein EAO71_33010 [Streptomyces sp. ms191]